MDRLNVFISSFGFSELSLSLNRLGGGAVKNLKSKYTIKQKIKDEVPLKNGGTYDY